MHPHIIHEKETMFELGTIENNVILYDFDKIVAYLNYKGKLLFGKEFKIYDEDLFLVYKLCLFYIRDYKNCEKYGIDPYKGILLSGPVGCGKTSLMKLLKCITPEHNSYQVIPCRQITFQFNGKGYPTIEMYGSSNSYCFDDLGVEPDGKHFGQDCNVMGEVLLSRHDLFIQNKRLTYATTNLNANELGERYGTRVRSRMRQLFNLVAFDKDCRDKR